MHLQRKPNPNAEMSDLEIGRNPSYRDSLALGFERGVFRAPTSFLHHVGWPLLSLGISLLMVVFGTAIWLGLRVHLIVAGLAGVLRQKTVLDSQSVLTDKAAETAL